MVASIGKIAAPSQGVGYSEKDGYYAKEDAAHKEASAWAGKGAEALGLSGPVDPEAFRRAGAGAWATPSSQVRQAYFGRTVTITRSCAGTISSLSLRSSPIRTISPQPQGQSVLFGSITCSIRGRCAGKWPILRAGRGRFCERAGEGSLPAAPRPPPPQTRPQALRTPAGARPPTASPTACHTVISSRFRCSRRRMRAARASFSPARQARSSVSASFAAARQALSAANASFSTRSVSSAASACLAACPGVSVSRSISVSAARLVAQCRGAGGPDPPLVLHRRRESQKSETNLEGVLLAYHLPDEQRGGKGASGHCRKSRSIWRRHMRSW